MLSIECIIRYCASNDKDGNPRRVYVHWKNYLPVKAYDEGYKGYMAMPLELQTLPREDKQCTVGMYKDFLRFYK